MSLKYHFCPFTYNCKDLRDMLTETNCTDMSQTVNYKAAKMFSVKTTYKNTHNFLFIF